MCERKEGRRERAEEGGVRERERSQEEVCVREMGGGGRGWIEREGEGMKR